MAENAARHCPVCNLEHQEDDPTHNGSSVHRFNFLLLEWNKDRKSMVRNRHGVEVAISFKGTPLTHNVNVGKHYYQITPATLLEHGNCLNFKCTVTNRRSDPIVLAKVVLLHPYSWFSFHDPNNNNINEGNRVQLLPNANYSVMVTFSPGQSVLVGGYNIPVCFIFQSSKKKVENFTIARSINVSVEESLVQEFPLNASPFTSNPWPRGLMIHPPIRRIPFSNKYSIPHDKRKCLLFGLQEYPGMRGPDFTILRDQRRQMEPGHVTMTNYRNFWHNVLWLEEVGQELGLQQYNMENVALNLMENGRLELIVPGLAEKRPSVIVKDLIDIRLHDDHTGYRGIIRQVNDMTVEIDDVDEEIIQIVEGTQMREDFDVKFVLSRLSFERRHQGVDHVVDNNLVPILFPPSDARLRIRQKLRVVTDVEFLNQTIVTNEEQKTAVRNILNLTSAPYPYIVFGPPGTGKTVTIVEAILQIKNKTTHNILVCAPSNAACDMITEKLLEHCNTKELLRVMSSTVDISNVHEVVIPYTNYDGDNNFRNIDSAVLKTYRIIVTTLILIGKYETYRPDAVFIDEAAQASEPEACIALGMLTLGKLAVLAGDPKQLGPSLNSDASKRYGLGISLLERLMKRDFYSENNPNCITMLIQNFRNHEVILSLPNKLFYGNQLEARSARAALDPISRVFIFEKIQGLYEKSKKKTKEVVGQPVEFCSLLSKESREGKSPSYYNQKELQMALKYIQALLALTFEDETYNVVASDVGVVTPYVRQVHKLKCLLKLNNVDGIEVGTAETFQGREKRVMIVSTVRAQKDLLLYDKLYRLGFVRNEKRFNVVMTRAMSKLIVIGCAHVLGTDRKWLSYIDRCEEVRGFCGAPFAKRTDDVINEITRRMDNVNRDTQYNHQ